MRMETEYCCEVEATGDTRWSKFNASHAQEIRAYWEEGEGLKRADAEALVDKWNRMNRGYKYSLHA